MMPHLRRVTVRTRPTEPECGALAALAAVAWDIRNLGALVSRNPIFFYLALLSTSFLMLACTILTLARMSSAVAVQTNGFALAFQWSM